MKRSDRTKTKRNRKLVMPEKREGNQRGGAMGQIVITGVKNKIHYSYQMKLLSRRNS